MKNQPRLRWNYFKDRLIEQFGSVVYKIGVDAGFTCPNRDGSKGFGGCAYCSQLGSLSPNQDPNLGIREQIEKGIAFTQKRYGAEKYIVYFQSFTNTYEKIPVLRERFESALIHPHIVGMSVATRPDCIDLERAEFLKEYQERFPYFTVELGLQSAYQNRLEWVNRQETLEDYLKAMEILNRMKIPVITHVILGFPGESLKDMSDTVQIADVSGSHGIKLQMLHIIKGTKLAHLYLKNPEDFPLMEQKEYVDTLVYLVERINPEIEMHRITGETEREMLVAPDWVRHKTQVFDRFDKLLEEQNTFQGRLDWAGKERRLSLKPLWTGELSQLESPPL